MRNFYRKLTYGEKQQADKLYPNSNYKYILLQDIAWYSKRYKKWVRCKAGMLSDGASGAMDIESYSWWYHDQLCNTGVWDDGTPCTNWQASQVISRILYEEWKYNPLKQPFRGIRAILWRPATWLFGGGKCRDNGMF